TTDDAALAEALRRSRSLGADAETGKITRPSGNFRLTELQAAVALPQVARLDADLRRREQAAAVLAAALAGSPYFQPLERYPRVTRHGSAQFWIRYAEAEGDVPRARVAEAVQAEGIPLFAGWPRPNYTLGVYVPARAAGWLRARDSGREPRHYERTCCPHAERAAFSEALLLDLPILEGDAATVRDAATALAKVAEGLSELRTG
ncbi:MAG TPA: DegT/DnrJ/EryC1/StrS family aminotransferase, partial [Armatimonadota bacterium]|nr:DegT/DnrJ/EryC1/StrS family aminotransferase [Armatimonadota bacterium]